MTTGAGCGPAQVAAEPAAAAPEAATVPAAEAFDVNPRTMQQAVDNLARFTSDQPAGANLCQHWILVQLDYSPGAVGCCNRCDPDL